MARVKWLVEFEVAEGWVVDGFVMTDETVNEMIQQRLGLAYSHEIPARVIAGPSAARLAKLQGYGKDVPRFLASGPYVVKANVVNDE